MYQFADESLMHHTLGPTWRRGARRAQGAVEPRAEGGGAQDLPEHLKKTDVIFRKYLDTEYLRILEPQNVVLFPGLYSHSLLPALWQLPLIFIPQTIVFIFCITKRKN